MMYCAELVAWLELMYTTHHRCAEDASRVLYIIKTIRSRHERGNIGLAQALVWSKDSLATDPRDKIYGIVGLVSRGLGVEIEPDYTKSLCAVYCTAICTILDDWYSNGIGDLSIVTEIVDSISDPPLHSKPTEASRTYCEHARRLRQGLHPIGASLLYLPRSENMCDGESCGLNTALSRAAKFLNVNMYH
jgi:hypothetical protein